ncbi:hypothetical protein BD310DRAFT_275173 [Dichomitus squalens]|uniref:Uncharacterized protein n=1 Tax=Dichomitus squalens TaxID=114155 RepID=A0A4Q9PH01_9APHY|nr:hypothetical protein BD310DRAFT_275173 [Dichomitus squalens]
MTKQDCRAALTIREHTNSVLSPHSLMRAILNVTLLEPSEKLAFETDCRWKRSAGPTQIVNLGEIFICEPLLAALSSWSMQSIAISRSSLARHGFSQTLSYNHRPTNDFRMHHFYDSVKLRSHITGAHMCIDAPLHAWSRQISTAPSVPTVYTIITVCYSML